MTIRGSTSVSVMAARTRNERTGKETGEQEREERAKKKAEELGRERGKAERTHCRDDHVVALSEDVHLARGVEQDDQVGTLGPREDDVWAVPGEEGGAGGGESKEKRSQHSERKKTRGAKRKGREAGERKRRVAPKLTSHARSSTSPGSTCSSPHAHTRPACPPPS